jgi:hypothetical protein
MVIIAPFLYLRIVAPMDKMAFWLMIGVTIMVSLDSSYSCVRSARGIRRCLVGVTGPGKAVVLTPRSLWSGIVGWMSISIRLPTREQAQRLLEEEDCSS